MEVKNGTSKISRADFGNDFIFGASTSSYQIEGATDADGRGTGIWDTWIQNYPYYIRDRSNAKTASDSYYKYKEDVKIMAKIGLDAYRFSISWTRILPGGKLSAGLNKEGIAYYNDLIDQLVANDIKPVVTLFHWDLPQALQDEYGGWLGRQIVKDFRRFAELCFWEFGDRVKHWITLNEPTTFVICGYVMGEFPPGEGLFSPDHFLQSGSRHRFCRLDVPIQPSKPRHGHPGTDPYRVAHHMLLAHAEAVNAYREFFKAHRGKIGISLSSEWCEPLYNTEADRNAVGRALDFSLGWFMEPLVKGRYPYRMIERVGTRLPTFSEEESNKLIGSYDFLGLNYYTGQYATDDTSVVTQAPQNYLRDRGVTLQNVAADGKTLIGPQLGTSTLCYYPEGLYKLLCRIKSEYDDPLVYITENGMDQASSSDLTIIEACEDGARIKYISGHLEYLYKAINENGVNVQAYFVWGLLDDFEWSDGYEKRYGIIYVDFKHKCVRIPKHSALWYMNFLDYANKSMGLPPPKTVASLPPKRAITELNDQESSRKKATRR